MTSSFLHGVQVIDVDDGNQTISVASTSVIGIIGTAPNADPTVFPLNTPVLCAGSQSMAASLTALTTAQDNGTLPDAIDSIFQQSLAALVIVRVDEGTDSPTTLANVIGGINSQTGQYEGLSAFLAAEHITGVKPRIIIAPGFTHQLVTGALTNIVAATPGTLYPDGTYDLVITDVNGGLGTGGAATVTFTGGTVSAVTITDEGQNYTNPTATLPGNVTTTGVAAAFTLNIGNTSNAVIASLASILTSLRAVAIQDGPNTTDSAALAVAAGSGNQRVYLVDPMVLKTDLNGNTVSSYMSAITAGLIAQKDNAVGFWASPSNTQINGVIGTARPIPFSLGDSTCSANVLNAGNVATVVRSNGFRLWGNRTLSSDSKWQFLCVVRTADIIADSLQAAHLDAVDQGITKNYVSDVQEDVNAFLRGLVTEGAILGGECWVDPDLNPASAIANGQVSWDFDFTPVYPAEDLTFRMHLDNNYITSIF